MDRVDVQILNLLQDNAKLPQADIAKQVSLSPAAVNERIKKLETQGVIRRYVALLDEEKIGCDVTAFIEVFIEHPRFEKSFVHAMKALPEVQEVHHVTGEFSCLLKIKTRDRTSLKVLLLDRINALEGVRQTRTVIVLSTSKEETRIAFRESDAGKDRETLSF